MNVDFLNEAGVVGGLLGLSILGLIQLWRKNESLHDKIDTLEDQRVDDAKYNINHVIITVENLENDMKAIILALGEHSKREEIEQSHR